MVSGSVRDFGTCIRKPGHHPKGFRKCPGIWYMYQRTRTIPEVWKFEFKTGFKGLVTVQTFLFGVDCSNQVSVYCIAVTNQTIHSPLYIQRFPH